ncbi:MAG TPA: aminotransferase class I/II-fold pyridoxal phosphate-dependent enzyme, partial [Bdellovibrionota bacterium]|nr:aminotransferase class I/II-fold pyridoxal phosphate-dependent enzyme [Bdellovibrionota bacterium]
ALTQSQDCVEEMRQSYRIKKDIVVKGLTEAGLHVYPPGAAFYIWFKKPESFENSKDFSKYVLDKAGVVITPGNGFGEYGEGYMRISLTAPLARLKEAVSRMKSVL